MRILDSVKDLPGEYRVAVLAGDAQKIGLEVPKEIPHNRPINVLVSELRAAAETKPKTKYKGENLGKVQG